MLHSERFIGTLPDRLSRGAEYLCFHSVVEFKGPLFSRGELQGSAQMRDRFERVCSSESEHLRHRCSCASRNWN